MNKEYKTLNILSLVLFCVSAVAVALYSALEGYGDAEYAFVCAIIMLVVFFVAKSEEKTGNRKWCSKALVPLYFVLHTTVATQALLDSVIERIDDDYGGVALFAIGVYLIPYALYLGLLIPKYIPSVYMFSVLTGKREPNSLSLNNAAIISTAIICCSTAAAICVYATVSAAVLLINIPSAVVNYCLFFKYYCAGNN